MSRRGKDCACARVERGREETLPSQIESRNRCLPFRSLTRHLLKTLRKPPPLLPGSTCPRPPPRPPIPAPCPAPAPPPASLANPCAGLQTSRGFHRLCRLEKPYVRRRACPEALSFAFAPPPPECSVQKPCESSSCRKAASCRGISRRWRLTALETLRLPACCGAKASAMFGAGDEDDADFLSPSGG